MTFVKLRLTTQMKRLLIPSSNYSQNPVVGRISAKGINNLQSI